MGAAFRACDFRRSATLCMGCEGYETDNWAREPGGMRRRQRWRMARSNAQRRRDEEGMTERRMTMLKFARMPLHRHGRACPGHPRLTSAQSKAWMPGPRPG